MSGAGRACGKVILLGEHAVVYGIPAIAVGIDRGACAHAVALKTGPSLLHVRGWNIRVRENEEQHDLARAFRALLESARDGSPSFTPHAVDVDADLPPGGGLGCSAAMGVAIARALEPRLGPAAIQDRAMAWERIFHGNPSGVDAAVAARGGCVVFRKGSGVEPIRARGTIHLCIGNTAMASSTKSMVEAVARLRARKPEKVQRAFASIRELVSEARMAIEMGNRAALGRLMDHNQTLLGGLYVTTPEIERLCALAREAGALGAKLTGAGGGGSVVALVPTQAVADAVLTSWSAAGFQGFSTHVAPEIRPHESDNRETETTP